MTKNEEQTVFECPKALPLFPNLSNTEQTAVILIALAYMGIVTFLFLRLYTYLDTQNPKWWSMLKQSWPFLGVLYALSGIFNHFVNKEIVCITPPNGTWNWWYMPVSEEFQLAATGYAEIIGGLLLAFSGFTKWAVTLRQQTALCLFFMTIGMTFANLYMLTHGVWAFEMEEPFPISLHIVRFTVQGLWFSNLWYMATQETLDGISSIGMGTKNE